MDKRFTESGEQTRALLQKHYREHMLLQSEDIFKYLFQSAFGCEHLASNETDALAHICLEYEALERHGETKTEALDGAYSRVYLSCLDDGLKPETLAKLFCRSAQGEPEGRALLEEKIKVAEALVANGEIRLDPAVFSERLAEWRARGYPAVHHSEAYREAYCPAYRVVADRYAHYLRVFSLIDRCLDRGPVILAIDGGSASGKSTLAESLRQVYSCNVFHMDDFFLRPEQRTRSRLAEVGGNVDRERFLEEVLLPLRRGEAVCYRRFDCANQCLSEPVTALPKRLAVVEGAYSMHPLLADHYNLSVFLEVRPEHQRARILRRNTPEHSKRFFEEWIPMERDYFAGMQVPQRCDLSVTDVEG